MELRDKEVEVRETGVPADDNYDVQDVEFLLAGGRLDDDCGC
jgi:hypothetical protein